MRTGQGLFEKTEREVKTMSGTGCVGGGIFGPGGVGFWVFLLILALLGIAWAQGGLGGGVMD